MPTFAESGLPDFRASSWFGVLVRQGTPKPVVDLLTQSIWDIANSKDFRDTVLVPNGYEPAPSVPPEKFLAFLQEDRKTWHQLIERMGANAATPR